MPDEQQTARSKRRFRIKIGWYAVPALALLAMTIWLLANMAQGGGSALTRVVLGIAIVLIAAALLFKAIDGPTSVD
jgi:hypothetical protein